MVFVDTSAFFAVFDRSDANHQRADGAWRDLLQESAELHTTNYVLLETSALLQHRLGVPALRAFHEVVAPLLTVEWISGQRHRAAVEAVLAAGGKRLSIVDCSSFETMRERGIRRAFAFDSHFREQDFELVP